MKMIRTFQNQQYNVVLNDYTFSPYTILTELVSIYCYHKGKL